MSHTAFDFTHCPDRAALPCLKWGRYEGRDVLPLWVADMDFTVAPEITRTLAERVAHPIYGYTHPWPSLVEATVEGIAYHHGWHIDPDWLVWLPGVVPGFNLACQLAGQPGDEILFASPAYPPFFAAPSNQQRRAVPIPMRVANGRWELDRDALEAAITPATRMFLFCNPHNPTGRVFTAEELHWVAEFCQRHDLLLCSDDIHCGLVLDDARTPHLPIARQHPELAPRTITLMAPSKTWNIAGLQCAFAIIADPALRQRFRRAMNGLIDSSPNLLGLTAAEAAWRHGADWLTALKAQLRANLHTVQQALPALPGCTLIPPEATFLAWIDCRGTGLADPTAFFEQAGVGLNNGKDFGLPGFVRLNFACPPQTLHAALARMQAALPVNH